MPSRRQPADIEAAIRRFRRDGVVPALAVVRPMRSNATLSKLFAADLADEELRPLSDPPTDWHELDVAEAELLLAFCRHRSLAYHHPRGSAGEHRAAARALLDALAVEESWSNSNLHEAVDPTRLALRPNSSHHSTNLFSNATFEQDVLLVGAGFAALVVWTDED